MKLKLPAMKSTIQQLKLGVSLTATLVFQSLVSQPALADSDVFLESNGLVVIEAESMPVVGQWELRSEVAGFKGTGYLHWTGPIRLAPNAAVDRDAITYHFKIENAGNYEFRFRSYIAGGDSALDSNDSWVRFPTGENIDGELELDGWTKAFQNQFGQWSWGANTEDHVNGGSSQLRQYFSAGVHYLQISGRSTDHAVDRMILFNADLQGFAASIMDNAPESDRVPSENQSENSSEEESGNNEAAESGDGETEQSGNGETEENNDSEAAANESNNNLIVDWLATEEAPEPNVCQSGVLSLALSKQAYVSGGTLSDPGELRVDGVSRTALLGFSLQDVPPTAASAHLEMTVGEDNGHGILMLGLGSHNDWQAGQSADNVPDVSALINEFAGVWESGNRHALPIDPSLLNDETVSILLSMQAGANDMSIVADYDSLAPTLVLNGDNAFCDQYNANRSAREAASESSTQTENTTTNSEATETEVGTEADTENEVGTETEAETTAETGSVEETTDASVSEASNGSGASSDNDSGSGALTLFSGVLLFLLVLLKRSNAIRENLRKPLYY